MENYQVASKIPAVVWVSPKAITDRIDAQPFQPELVEMDELLAQYSDCVTIDEKLRRKRGMSGGATPLGANYLKEGFRFIRTENVTPNWIDLSKVVYISAEDFKKLERSALEEDDVLLTITGALFGQSATVYPQCLPANISQHSVRMHFSKDVNPRYVSTYLNSKYGQAQIQMQKVGATRSAINYDGIKALKLPLPPRPVQTYIGDKVRLAERCRSRARELWHTSEQMLSQALDLSLDTRYFESVNRGELQSEHYHLMTAEPVTAWVHPDIVSHELGAQYFHPRRANVIVKLRESRVHLKRLAELALRRNKRVSGDKIYQVPYYIGLSDIDNTTGHINLVSPQQTGITGTSTLFKSDDILFSKLRPYLNKVSICPAHVKRACGSTELLVYRVHEGILPYYVFFVLKSNIGLYQVIDITAGSTLPRVDPEIVDDILVPMIDDKVQRIISDNVQQVFELLHKAASLVAEAKADVEALIEGRLDVEGIVAGRVVAPTWEETYPRRL